MKYLGKQKNLDGAFVYTFALGFRELSALRDVVRAAYNSTQPFFKNLQLRGRLRNINKGLTLACDKQQKDDYEAKKSDQTHEG